MSIRDVILATVNDNVSNLMYYDRKEDEDLGEGDIEKAIKDGEITIDEIVAKFRETLEAGCL